MPNMQPTHICNPIIWAFTWCDIPARYGCIDALIQRKYKKE